MHQSIFFRNSGLKSRLQSLEEEVLCLKKAKNDNEQEIQVMEMFVYFPITFNLYADSTKLLESTDG